MHSAVEAALELSTGPLSQLRPGDVARIVVETHPLARSLDDAAPRTVLGAQFSLPHAVAAVLVFGNTESNTFGSRGLDDESLAAVRSLVEIVPYPGDLVPPHDRPARVTVTLRTGEQHVAECASAIGGPDRPLSEGDVLDKVEQMTAKRAPQFARVAAALVDGAVEDAANWSEVLEEMWSR
jgi:2-methylcitrate dehydratase PrpD